MGEHRARIVWERDGADFIDRRYSRSHRWEFDGGVAIPASSSPAVVPEPMSVAAAVDPEEGFVAAISSCHMLFVLARAAQLGLVIERYEDDAVAVLGTTADGKRAITAVRLQPQVEFHGHQPDGETEHRLHAWAHANCYLANSVRAAIEIIPRSP